MQQRKRRPTKSVSCPKCGYCDKCGRSNAAPVWPWPVVYPAPYVPPTPRYPWQQPWITWGMTTSSSPTVTVWNGPPASNGLHINSDDPSLTFTNTAN